jgi:hypothetical protein
MRMRVVPPRPRSLTFAPSVDSIAISELLSACTFNIVASGSAITAESFLPANSAIDAAETTTVNLTLRNTGTAGTTALSAVLLSSDGVLDPGPPQVYGAILPGGTAAKPFTFRADPLLGCGGVLTATLQLSEGSTDLGTVAFKILLAGNRLTILSENFDGVTAPLLPPGWSTSKTDASPTLGLHRRDSGHAPNTALINAPEPLSDKRLDSPVFFIKSAAAQLSFRHFNLNQTGFDGGVLEISLNGGAFTDILARRRFVLNGYDGVISPATGIPAGRLAWTVTQGGFRTSTVNLPASAAENVQLRWRFGSDNATASAGWQWITVTVSDILFPAITTSSPRAQRLPRKVLRPQMESSIRAKTFR